MAIGKRRGLRPNIVYWIYTVVVRLTQLYGSADWKKITTGITLRSNLEKVQRSAAYVVTRSPPSIPSKAMLTFLYVVTLDPYGNATQPWKNSNVKHANTYNISWKRCEGAGIHYI